MNEHQNDFQPPMELPKPHKEGSNTPAETGRSEHFDEQKQGQAIEQGSVHSGSNSQQSVTLPASSQHPSTAPISNSSSLSANDLSSTDTLIADDVDLIEKEWVYKAKEIVERTKNDPHTQNKKMNEVKADYLKKRYNRELKLTED